jgi:hypothetical protein
VALSDGSENPILPDYGSACIDSVVPALLGPREKRPPWLPAPARDARQIVLLVLDGLGWEQLTQRASLTPVLNSMEGGPITSVVPSTTATALTSITTGLSPAQHGVVGYRIHVGDHQVLNVLRWSIPSGDAREAVPPARIQRAAVFGGTPVPVVTRAEFAGSGFTSAHLSGAELHGWRLASTLRVEVANQVAAGAGLVYAYYDGVDLVAHEFGLQAHYEAELQAADRLVGDLVSDLPPGAALVVTADHGHLEVGDATIALDQSLAEDVILLSGEARFRWLHVGAGAEDRVVEATTELYGKQAWIRTRRQIIDDGWLGGRPSEEVERRLGDVAIVARDPVAFLDPADPVEARFVSRHGSLTGSEMWVPLVAAAG